MTVRLYLDVYFILNFAMDYLLLFLVKRLLRLAARPWRLFLAATVGAGWACITLLLPRFAGWAQFLTTWFLAGGAMVVLAFGKRGGFREVGLRLALFWLVSMGMGGAFSLWANLDFAGGHGKGAGVVHPKSLLVWCLWAAGGYFGICGCLRLLGRQMKYRHALYQVRLSCRGITKTVNALWDTGNQLYEPYGHQPVHVITSEVCRQLCDTVSRMIYIPFRTVGAEYGIMPGIRIDFMEVERDGRLIRRYERPWLAISQNPLSADHRYEMLLHGEGQGGSPDEECRHSEKKTWRD